MMLTITSRVRSFQYLLSLFGVLVVLASCRQERKEVDLFEHTRYTIGEVISVAPDGDKYSVRYSFHYQGVAYELNESYSRDLSSGVGRKYVIMFSYKNPNNSAILDDQPVCEEPDELPSDGWDRIPEDLVCPGLR